MLMGSMKKPNVSFYTLGCRLNQAETATLQRSFEARGYGVVDFKKPSDLVVINTCTVTANGDADTRRVVNKINRINPRAEIALIGCQAQMQGERLAQMPSVRWVVGNNRKMALPEIIEEEWEGSKARVLTEKISRDYFTMPTAGIDRQHTRANLKIQDGCDFYCLFCEIPYARGRARSRVLDDLLQEAEVLTDAGHRELVLTGVNIGTYSYEDKRILDVLKSLLALPKLERLRISSIEPTTIPEEIISLMADEEKLCRYLHIPLQSGHDYILKKMNRRYDMAEFTEFLQACHEGIPDVCLGTDLIVGYPGESDAYFDETMDHLREQPYAYMHVFSYSERTMAKSKKVFAKDNVDPKVIAKRSEAARELSDRKRRVFMEQFVGREMPVLFEQQKKGLWTGLTDNYLRVAVESDKDLKNEMIPVKLKAVEDELLMGDVG